MSWTPVALVVTMFRPAEIFCDQPNFSKLVQNEWIDWRSLQLHPNHKRVLFCDYHPEMTCSGTNCLLETFGWIPLASLWMRRHVNTSVFVGFIVSSLDVPLPASRGSLSWSQKLWFFFFFLSLVAVINVLFCGCQTNLVSFPSASAVYV